jgi:NADH:ubiquinone oxidoreductase subunit D
VGIDDIDRLLTKNEIFFTRCRDIGVISKEDAIDYGLSGPMLRACGLPFDLRRAEPYSIYDRFDFDIPSGTHGDVYDRYLVRMEEMRQSVRIVEQAIEQMPDGPIMPEKAPRRLRLPPGEVYTRTENPRGEYGIYLVSKGGEKPYRLKIRSSCLSNLTALKQMVVGHYVADAVVILGSVDIVLGEVDR